MQFRIGVNLGDVIQQGDGTVYGDGVNIAACLEGLAEPGGVTLSGVAHDFAKRKVKHPITFLGEHEVKNIDGALRVYRVGSETDERSIEAPQGVAAAERARIDRHLEKLFASPPFINADRLRKLLSYMLDATLDGRDKDLNQYAIALDVYGRDQSYDPATDSLVRVEAGRLRTKLNEYYAEGAPADGIRLRLPKGGYRVQVDCSDKVGTARTETVSIPGSEESTIAVLPFNNLSTDPDQEHLIDAMTVDIITGLSCDKRFSVIAYNSVMQFKGNVPDIRELGKILGVRYVVEGTVRIIGPRLRVSTALIEVETRRELWGDKIDRAITDIFDVFDELVEAIVTALGSHLKMAEEARFRRKPPGQLDAWAMATRASVTFFLNPTTTLDEPLSLVRRALEIDPEYAYAWAVLGFLTALKFPLGLSEDHQADIDESFRATDKALTLDAGDPWNLLAKSVALQYAGRPAESMEYLQRSLRLNPGDVVAHCYYGRGLLYSGKSALAIAHFERFKRLNPNDPGAHMAGMYHSLALVFLQRWEEAEEIARRAVAASGGRNHGTWVMLMVALGGQGKSDDATAVIPELIKVAPHWNREFVEKFLTECQKDKELLPPVFEILRRVWPDENTGNVISFSKKNR